MESNQIQLNLFISKHTKFKLYLALNIYSLTHTVNAAARLPTKIICIWPQTSSKNAGNALKNANIWQKPVFGTTCRFFELFFLF
jgi:hypothetical protein